MSPVERPDVTLIRSRVDDAEVVSAGVDGGDLVATYPTRMVVTEEDVAWVPVSCRFTAELVDAECGACSWAGRMLRFDLFDHPCPRCGSYRVTAAAAS